MVAVGPAVACAACGIKHSRYAVMWRLRFMTSAIACMLSPCERNRKILYAAFISVLF